MTSSGTWTEVESLRCKCLTAETEEVEGLPNCIRCKTCGGWFALRVSDLRELKLVRDTFARKVAA